MICREPGCGELVLNGTRCEACRWLPDCAGRALCRNVARGTNSDLCPVCAARSHPGKLLYKGRWRGPDELFDRIRADPAMKRVLWTYEDGTWVGRDQGFEMRLRIKAPSTETPIAVTYAHGVKP